MVVHFWGRVRIIILLGLADVSDVLQLVSINNKDKKSTINLRIVYTSYRKTGVG
jgi:hypothetical protein